MEDQPEALEQRVAELEKLVRGLLEREADRQAEDQQMADHFAADAAQWRDHERKRRAV